MQEKFNNIVHKNIKFETDLTSYIKQIRTLEIEIMEKDSELAKFHNKRDYNDIEITLKELEDIKNKLLKENERLKIQLNEFSNAKLLDLNAEANEHVI